MAGFRMLPRRRRSARKSPRPRPAARRCRIEPLEARTVLSVTSPLGGAAAHVAVTSQSTSNVVAELVDGQLLIHGDDLANAIHLFTKPDGSVVVAGNRTPDHRPESSDDDEAIELLTLVNGLDDAAEFSGVQDVVIAMNGGDDLVLIRRDGWPYDPPGEVVILGNLVVDMGPDDDKLMLNGSAGRLAVNGTVTVEDPGGNDHVSLYQVEIGQDVSIVTSGGNDFINLSGQFGGDVDVNTHEGRDTVMLLGSVAGNARLISDAGGGLLSVENAAISGNLTMRSGEGDRVIRVHYSTVNGDATLDSGADDDELEILEAAIGGQFALDAGDGNDRIYVGMWRPWRGDAALAVERPSPALGVHAAGITLSGGGGNDLLVLRNSIAAEDLDVSLGTGDDELEAVVNHATHALLDGGDGSDLVDGDVGSNNNFDELAIVNFEATVVPHVVLVDFLTEGEIDDLTAFARGLDWSFVYPVRSAEEIQSRSTPDGVLTSARIHLAWDVNVAEAIEDIQGQEAVQAARPEMTQQDDMGVFVFPGTFTDLGEVDFRQFDEAGPDGGEFWYRLEAPREGILTVTVSQIHYVEIQEPTIGPGLGAYAIVPSDEIWKANLRLYVPGEGGQLEEVGSGDERVDFLNVMAGQEYYVHATNVQGDAFVRVANMVAPNSGTGEVVVLGSSGDDEVRVRQLVHEEWAMLNYFGAEPKLASREYAGVELLVNGLRYTYREDHDGITSVRLEGIEDVRVSSNASGNTRPGVTQSVLRNGKQVEVRTDATYNVPIDVFVTEIDMASLEKLTLSGSMGLDEIHAYYLGEDFRGTVSIAVGGLFGGEDTAYLYDSPGDDRFTASPSRATFELGGAYDVTVTNARYVHAYATAGGEDVAFLYGAGGDDAFLGTPVYGKMYGDGYANRAKHFEYVHAYGGDGHDTAVLRGSPGDDEAIRKDDYTKLYGDGFFLRAKYFEETSVYGGGGNDRAWLVDSVLDDVLAAEDNWAQLSNDAWLAKLLDFATVQAHSNRGGDDTTDVAEPLGFTLNLYGDW